MKEYDVCILTVIDVKLFRNDSLTLVCLQRNHRHRMNRHPEGEGNTPIDVDLTTMLTMESGRSSGKVMSELNLLC